MLKILSSCIVSILISAAGLALIVLSVRKIKPVYIDLRGNHARH